MSLGNENPRTTVNQTDTAELYAFVYNADESPVQANDIDSVSFAVRKPDGSDSGPLVGEIKSDGSGFLRWTDTTDLGKYQWVAQFTFNSGEKRSFRDEFVVQDPLDQTQSRKNKIAEQVWMRIEDCFDSEYGGPWLRDMTLAYFEPSKIERFIAEGLVYINGWPPLTNFGLDMFTMEVPDDDPALPPGSMQDDPDQIVIVQATLLAIIKHLMRSYVEQPAPQGANIVWQDRRDYLQRWQTIYQVEYQFFKEIIALWKRQFFHYGKSSLLVGYKAGRLGYGSGWRARNASRGYW